MASYKHYSFDLWLTLIKSNPLFKKHRSQFFHLNFNRRSISLEEVEHIFRQVDIMANTINERTGKNIDADEMYLMVISWMNNNQINLYDIDTDDLYLQMENLLFQYLPVVYCNNTAGVLSNLKAQGVTTNILSNTGFIKGTTLREVLKQLDLYDYFNFQIYSDEVGMSKPNLAIFELMIDQAQKLTTVEPSSIVHVGDNPKADIEGAQKAGINGILINSNQKSITSLNHATLHIFPS
ncbi:HAD family hydrolase [Mucilaginibacter lacusdianchii]|uniref:HAD family hydrolase n=1 Tax=Mucilaginibacter lacusdianchii TaxID=2684211 RepID=UPI00131C7553|nr:HAD family hydrolase [Mucilaginibacter sp. JXJ CY 39]